jgi:hypothetical protein
LGAWGRIERERSGSLEPQLRGWGWKAALPFTRFKCVEAGNLVANCENDSDVLIDFRFQILKYEERFVDFETCPRVPQGVETIGEVSGMKSTLGRSLRTCYLVFN